MFRDVDKRIPVDVDVYILCKKTKDTGPRDNKMCGQNHQINSRDFFGNSLFASVRRDRRICRKVFALIGISRLTMSLAVI